MVKSRELLGILGLLVFAVVVFHGRLLSSASAWCDQRVQQLSAEKDRSVHQAIDQMHEALAQQDASVEALRTERAAARLLRRRLDKLARADKRLRDLLRQTESAAAAAGGGSSSSSSSTADGDGDGGDDGRAAASELSTQQDAEQPPQQAEQPQQQQTPDSLVARSLVPSAMAVVVIAYNRPQYLERALTSIFSHHPGGDAFPIYVSQDGENSAVSAVTAKHGAHRLVHPRRTLQLQPRSYLSKFPGYAYLAVHYGWALETLFAMKGGGDAGGPYAGVIILEEDIEIAPDFFSYFTNTAPLLEADPTLLAVSAFNDNGQAAYRGDPTALHRSDFFPGLGWLLTRSLWGELGPKWPNEKGFWDDWLREPPQRKGRATIRPEVSRTYTFGKSGTSVGQFYGKYLEGIALNAEGVDWSSRDLRYLLHDEYEVLFAGWLKEARVLESVGAAKLLGARRRKRRPRRCARLLPR